MCGKSSWVAVLVVVITSLSLVEGLESSLDIQIPPLPKPLSELKDALVSGLGFQSDKFNVSGFDVRDTLVGHSVAYEFDVEIDNEVKQYRLLEDINKWDFVDLPIFRLQHNPNGLVDKRNLDDGLPVLEPFQLAGPMEIFIQDANDMRISLPHDVDAGVLKKVVLADGAVVTVKGARSVSLRHPLDLPLPLKRSHDGFASGLVALAEQLRHASQAEGAPVLSLRIVGPTSLTSPSSPQSSNNRLKLKRLAPGLVELSSPTKSPSIDSVPPINLLEAPTVLTPKHYTTMWPLASVNGSNSNLLGFEKLLASVLGPKANKKGSFKLLKADVLAQTFVKVSFGVERKLKEEDWVGLEGYPAWRTKPELAKIHFEVLAKVEGEKVVAEKVVQVNPVTIEDVELNSMFSGNVSMSRTPVIHHPSSPFTL